MSSRYLTNAIIAVLGGSLVVFSQSFGPGVIRWTGFGVAIVILVVTLIAQLDAHRGAAQRGLDAAMAITAATLIVFAAGAFSGTTMVWLVFAFGLAFLGIAITGLTLHEIETWRDAHDLGQLHWLTPAGRGTGAELGQSSERAAA
jgi:hypothetical protein